jgi:hypothetical protein
MNRRIDTAWQLLGSALIMSVCAAQAPAQAFISTARAIEDGATVRAGAGTLFYVVGELKKDTLVKIDDKIFDWYKIVPPTGVCSYIKTKDVDLAADGRSGVINTDRATVRAANATGPGDSYRRQLYLFKGDPIKLAATEPEGDYYKIVAPKGTYVYIHVSSVRRVDGKADKPVQLIAKGKQEEAPAPVAKTKAAEPQPEDLAASPAEAPKVIAEVTTPKTIVDSASPATPPQALPAQLAKTTPPKAAAVAQAKPQLPVVEPMPVGFAALEQRFAAVRDLPLEQQPIDMLLRAYEQTSSTDQLTTEEQLIIRYRIYKLKSNAQLAEALRQVDDARQRLVAANAATPQFRLAFAPKQYDAIGQIQPSSVYDGINLPRLHRLISSDWQTIAYIRPTPRLASSATLGRVVGVVGTWGYDPALKLRVLAATRIEVLEPSTSVLTADAETAAR